MVIHPALSELTLGLLIQLIGRIPGDKINLGAKLFRALLLLLPFLQNAISLRPMAPVGQEATQGVP